MRFATANPQVAPEVIETLLEEGCQINSSDQNGMTALMFACTNNNQPAAQVLLGRGADVTYQNNRGRTALMMCFYPELPNPALIRTILQVRLVILSHQLHKLAEKEAPHRIFLNSTRFLKLLIFLNQATIQQ